LIALEHHYASAGSLPLFLSQAKTWRAAAQPQKGRSASGALVTAVSKSVHACLRASESVATPDVAWRVATRVLAHFGGQRFAIGERVGRHAVESHAALSKLIANARRKRKRRKKEKKEKERESRAHLLRPDIDLACSEPPRLRSSNTFRRNRDFS